MQFKKIFAAAVLACGAVAQNTTAPALTTVLRNTSSLSNLTTFVQLIPSLLSQLNTSTNVTILAPSNAAFAKYLNTTAGASLAGNTTALQALLSYHVLNGSYYAANITSTPRFPRTLLTNASYANVTGGQVVEAVLSGNRTLFFSGLLNNATASQADIRFSGGLIHVIDTVLRIPSRISTTAIAANLTSAVGALTNTSLVSTVDNLNNVTVFLPNNAAFQRIGSSLSNLTSTQIASILKYHVVNGTVAYSTRLTNSTLATLQGPNLTVRTLNGSIFVNSARVVTPNLLVANGVVHIIDGVLNPMNTTVAPNATASTAPAAFSGASSATNVPFTSGISTPTAVIATGGLSSASASAASSAKASSSSTSKAGAEARATGAIGAAALFGAGAAAVAMGF